MEFCEDERGKAISRAGHTALYLGEDRGDVQRKGRRGRGRGDFMRG
jgi:hypothetical protein